MQYRAIPLGLVVGAGLICHALVTQAMPATIVFCSERDGDNEIYMMDADGGNLSQLTFNTSGETGAMCSPDGRRIAFVSDRDGDYEIYVINTDGTGLTRLTEDPGSDLGPSWSRDGSRIAFMSDRDGDREIFVMNSDGGELQQITQNDGIDGFPDLSPDGTQVAYHSDRGGTFDIWVSHVDGTNAQQITIGTGSDWMPEWSPDGSQIVFESDRHGPLELYIMAANGANVRRLTYTNSDNHEPDWSPDGSLIMFSSWQGADYDIMLINPYGSGLVNLTNDSPSADWGPSWLPEVIGDEANGGVNGILAYCNQPVSAPDLHEIYTIHIDGTQRLQLIDAPLGLNHHEWAPDAEKLAMVGYVDATTSSIYVFDGKDDSLTRLTHTAGVWDNEPSWSPDGTMLAWGRIYPTEGYRTEIWIMDADGTGQHIIGVVGDGVRWSPDGTRLLYHKELANADIWTCAITGDDEQQLTTAAGNNIQPDWSPNGSQIAFSSDRDGNSEIYIMNADGSAPQRLTSNGVHDGMPTWSPDGTLIAFVRDVTGGYRWEVFVMDFQGANLRRVTHSPPDRTAINPDWQPKVTLVPVYLQSFRHVRTGNSVTLIWDVNGHTVAHDFRLMATRQNVQREIQVAAAGPRSFAAVDTDAGSLGAGTITYRLYLRGNGGEWELVGQESVSLVPPAGRTRITGVHPNPFNPDTAVSFSVDESQQVKLEIHDSSGRRVAKLVDEVCAKGEHTVRWGGRDTFGREVASGVYFAHLTTNNEIDTQKMVLVQ